MRSLKGKTIDDVYPSQYITPDDLSGKKFALTIKSVSETEVYNAWQRENVRRVLIGFVETDKGLICAPGRTKKIGDFLGKSFDGWINQKIVLSPGRAPNGKATIDVLQYSQPATPKTEPPQPKQNGNGNRPLRPEKLREALHKKNEGKSAQLQAMPAKTATAQVVAALLQRAFTQPPANGQSVEGRQKEVRDAELMYHAWLDYMWPAGDPPSANNCKQSELLATLDWLTGGTADFKAELNEYAVQEAWLVWDQVKISWQVEEQEEEEIPF